MKNIKSILVLALFIIGFVIMIGFIPLFFPNEDFQNLDSQKTFSDGSISFKCTGNFKNKINNYTENNGWITTQLDGINGSIYIKKSTVIKDPYIAQKEGENSSNYSNQAINGLLMHSEETNPKGIKIFKSITKYLGKRSVNSIYFIDFYFKDKNSVVYDISVYDFNGDYNRVSDRANEIFNSLTLN